MAAPSSSRASSQIPANRSERSNSSRSRRASHGGTRRGSITAVSRSLRASAISGRSRARSSSMSASMASSVAACTCLRACAASSGGSGELSGSACQDTEVPESSGTSSTRPAAPSSTTPSSMSGRSPQVPVPPAGEGRTALTRLRGRAEASHCFRLTRPESSSAAAVGVSEPPVTTLPMTSWAPSGPSTSDRPWEEGEGAHRASTMLTGGLRGSMGANHSEWWWGEPRRGAVTMWGAALVAHLPCVNSPSR